MSPILFCMFLNYISDVISHSIILLLADDANIFKNISCLDDAVKLQIDIKHTYEWCKKKTLCI